MNFKNYLAAVSMIMLPICGQAGVLYQWTGTNEATPWGITLEMEFDNRTVKSGELKLELDYDFYSADAEVPKHGLLGLRYAFPGMSNEMVYSSKDGKGQGSLWLDLQFLEGGRLAGTIYANDLHSHIRLASVGSLFTVEDANSDEGMPSAGCGWQGSPPVDCSGATGYFERVSKIPEPTSAALFAFGALAFAAVRRRTRASYRPR